MAFEHYKGTFFNINAGGYAHCDAGAKIVLWNDNANTGNQWRFDVVPADTIAKLEGPVNQAIINKKLTTLRDEVKDYYGGMKVKNGLTYDGKYGPNAGGLISSLMRTNSELPGNEFKNAVDRNVNSYYHSNWQSGGALPTTGTGFRWIWAARYRNWW